MNEPRASIPRWIVYITAIAVVVSWLPLAVIARARAVRSSDPKIHIVQDMGIQPKYKAQARSEIFADSRAMRPNVPDTIARGQLRDDDHLYRGRVNDDWAKYNAVPITEALVRRGQQRFEIYCAPCHGLAGAGDGPIHQRAVKLGEPKWVPPALLVNQQRREQVEGYLFDIITNGIRNMPAYGPQVLTEDRWAIIAYLRALQLSRDVSIQEVPVSERDRLR